MWKLYEKEKPNYIRKEHPFAVTYQWIISEEETDEKSPYSVFSMDRQEIPTIEAISEAFVDALVLKQEEVEKEQDDKFKKKLAKEALVLKTEGGI